MNPNHSTSAPTDPDGYRRRLEADIDQLAGELFRLAKDATVAPECKAFAAISAAVQLAGATIDAVPSLGPRLARAFLVAAQACDPVNMTVVGVPGSPDSRPN